MRAGMKANCRQDMLRVKIVSEWCCHDTWKYVQLRRLNGFWWLIKKNSAAKYLFGKLNLREVDDDRSEANLVTSNGGC